MTTLGLIILFTLLGSIASLAGGVILLYKESFAIRISHFVAAFAAGALLGTAFFDLLPEAVEGGKSETIFFWTLSGILVFFLLERVVHWFHHHLREHPEEEDTQPTVPLIMFGDSVHNFIDGVAIATTFLVSVPLGIMTAASVAAHEIPQEIGDFGLMLHKGLHRGKVLAFNFFSALTAIFGAVLTFFLGDAVRELLPVLLAVTAGFFIYIAASDLIPEIHHNNRKTLATIETILLLFGVFTIWVFVKVFN